MIVALVHNKCVHEIYIILSVHLALFLFFFMTVMTVPE